MSPALPVRAAPARRLPVRAQAGVLAALTALVVLLTGLLVPAAPASAQTRSQTTSQTPSQAHSQTKAQTTADLPLQVVLDSLTPPVPRPKGRLAVTGHVVNAGNATVKNVSVRLRLSRVKVVSRGDLAALAAGRSVRDGSPIGLPGTSADVGDLVPGASAPFTLTVALDDLRLGTLGVFPLSVEARGVRAGGQDGGSLRRLGITRTFLPWAPDPLEAVPTRLAWVWPLADVPHRRVDGVFVDDALAASLAPGGRLEGLVQGATGRPVTWLVDPMLLDDARAMSQGYRVAASSGGGSAAGGSPGQGGQAAPAPEQGTGGTAARAFLSDLVAATGTADVVALPFGDPDVRALLAAGQVSVLPAAVARGRATATDVLGRPVPSAVAAPPGGFASQAELEALRAAGSDAVLLDGRALPSTSPGTPTGRATVTVGGAAEPVALWDPTLSQLVSTAPSGPGGELLARQRFLAETEMVTAESPGVQRTVVIAPPHDWDVDPQRAAQLLSLTASAPWLTLVTLSEALAVPPPDVDRGPLVTAPPPPAGDDEGAGPGDPARATPLPTDYVRAVGTTVARGQSAAAVLQDPTPVRTSYQVEGERLVSAALRSDLRRGRALLEQTRSALAARIDAVRILPASATLGSSAADIPVTVVNDLDQPVTVKVAFFSGSPRLTVRPPGPVTVAPGSKARVLVPVTARANGVVDVSARLLTPAGDPLGDAVAVRVRIAQYGPAGVLVTAGAALLLFLGAAHNIYRRVRGRRAPSEQAAGAAAPSQPPAAGDQAAVEDGAAPAPESSGAQRPGTGDGAGSAHPLPGPR
ncbi:MAG TPA: DUF6049 family protein [Motilibacteraceae bacterium]|nr:DUF6049 family protein [Motilibacteraceae bacterium]